MEPWILCTFKSSVLPVSWPSQAKELGSQFLVLRTGAGPLCLQLHAFYGTGDGVFPVVMNGHESWTIKKTEGLRIEAFKLCWRRLLRVPWTAMRSNQSILSSQTEIVKDGEAWCTPVLGVAESQT